MEFSASEKEKNGALKLRSITLSGIKVSNGERKKMSKQDRKERMRQEGKNCKSNFHRWKKKI